MSLLDVSALNIDFNTREGVINAVNSVSFTVDRGENLRESSASQARAKQFAAMP